MNARFRIFLVVTALVGVTLVMAATSRYGAGVSSDAARNLSTADSLLAGNGFVDMVGAPFVLWPPLYPLLLAGLSVLTTLDTFRSAWYLNAFLFGANIWLLGSLLWTIFRGTPLLAVAGSLFLLLSRSTIRIHANVASEPLFITFMLVFFLAAARYLDIGSRASLWTMCVAAGLAALQRYLGVALLAVAAAVIWRRGAWRNLAEGPMQLVLTAAPLAVWAFLHNVPLSGAPFGPREMGAMLPFENMGLALTKILWWFIPRWGPLDWLILRPLLPLAVILGLLALINRRAHWEAWLRSLTKSHSWPALLFSLIYFVLLAFTVVTADHLDLTSDRYYVILMPSVVILFLVTLDKLLLPHLGSDRRGQLWILAGALTLWSIYPLYALQSYLRTALLQGEPTNYNIANSAQFREAGVVRAAEHILQEDPDAVVYSNYVNIAWFIFKHPIRALPYQDESLSHSARLTALPVNYPDWPPENAYLVWFTPNEYHHIVPPADLQAIAKLTLLFRDDTGEVYFVQDLAP